ncbi:hypothetical protein T4B_11695, partial [Trichinella pseudospiralis]
MTDVSGLCLVPNCYRDMCLVYKPRKPSHAHLAITPPHPLKRVKYKIYGHRAKRCLKLPSGPANLCSVQDIRDRRILVFAVDSNIRLLAAMQTWDMDGIFKVVPQWYEQLFTIRSFVMGKLVPAVYCLCTGKNIGTFGFNKQSGSLHTALIPVVQGYFLKISEVSTTNTTNTCSMQPLSSLYCKLIRVIACLKQALG